MAPRIGSLLYRVAGRQAKENAAAARAAKENAERSEALQTLRTIKAMTANQLTPNTNQKLLNTLQFIRRGPNRKLHRNAVEHVKFLKKARARGRWRAAVAVEKLKKGTVMSHITNPLFDTSNNNNEESLINNKKRAEKIVERAIRASELKSNNKNLNASSLFEQNENRKERSNRGIRAKKAAPKAPAINNTLRAIKNYKYKLAYGLPFNSEEAKKLIEAYNKAHRGRPGFINNANVRELRKQLKPPSSRPGFRLSLPKFRRANPPPPSFNEAAARNALKRYLNAAVKPKYNKALVNAILRLPKENLNNNTRRRLKSPRMYAFQRGAGALGRGAVTAGGALGRGAVTAGGALGRGAGALGRGAVTAGGAFGRGLGGFFSRSAAVPVNRGRGAGAFGRGLGGFFSRGAAAPVNNGRGPAAAPVNNGRGPAAPVNSEPKPASTTTGVSVGVGPGPGNHYENEYRYRRGGGGGGGIVFKPQITVGAARIGAQTFGGTRVGGQQMGGSRVRTGNTGSTTLKTGNTGGTQVSNVGKVSNAGRLAVSAPTSSGNRQLAATSEQLIRGAGGAEAVEQGIKALKAANGNVTRAKAASRLPNSTFTNIYAMGGPNAAKRLVETRRRRRTVGRVGGRRGRGLRVASKKRVTPKPRKQYIKLTPYQFRRLTDHIKKNNLRKVLIKEITH